MVVFDSVTYKFGYSFIKKNGHIESSVKELTVFMQIESFCTDCVSTVYFVPFEMIFLSFADEQYRGVDVCYKVADCGCLFVCKYKLHNRFTTVSNLENWQGVVAMLVQLDSKYIGVLLPVEFILGPLCIVDNELLSMRNSYSGWVFVMYDLIVRHNVVGACMVEKNCVVKVIGRSTLAFEKFPGLFQPEGAVFDRYTFDRSRFRQEILRQISQDHYDTTNLVRLLHYHDKKRKFVKL